MTAALRELLTTHRGDIVARFAYQVEKKELSPTGLSRSHLINDIPRFLDEIIEELAHVSKVHFSDEASDRSPTGRRHGQQRWSLGYDLEAVVREYGILRHAIWETVTNAGLQLTNDEFDVLAKCLNVGIAEAVTEYVRYRDQELETQKASLEFIARAGQLLGSSLDYRSTLANLTRLITPKLADWCVIAIDGSPLDESPIAHVVPEKVEVLRELLRRFPPSHDGREGLLEVIRSGQPQIVENVSPALIERMAITPEHLSLLHQVMPRSCIVVPLAIQSATLGAIMLAWSESERTYSPADLLLVEDLARRAAVAIDNARLYELSQKERARVESSMRAKDEFIATVSHELRTPLHAILGWAQLMRSGNLPPAKQEKALEVIERNANAQNQLIGDLLDMSRAIAGRIRITLNRIDLQTIVETAIEDSQTVADAKDVRLHVDLEQALIWGDTERLQQVVWNLISNAIKFNQPGGEIWIELRCTPSEAKLVIRDNGVGMEANFVPHAFEMFQQSDSRATRAHGGLGLGLSIAQHLVQLHGGSIEARSAGIGRGSEFVVLLPLGIGPAMKAKVTRESTTSGDAGLPSLEQYEDLRAVRILVVDDEEDSRELLRILLNTFAMEVRTAATAAEAIKELEGSSFQLVISDIGMPHEDGYSLIRSIRTMPSAQKDIPAIALTAFAGSEDQSRAVVAGFNRAMAKPVQAATLLDAIADLVRGRRTWRVDA